MCKIVRCRNCLILLLFLLICHHRHCASCCCCHVSLPWWHGTRLMWRWGCQADGLEDNGEALPQLIGEISPLSGVLPYVFLHRAQPTSCHKNRCDLNGWRQPPWCPNPDASVYNSHPTFGWLLYVAALGVGHYGGCETTVAAMVGERVYGLAGFSKFSLHSKNSRFLTNDLSSIGFHWWRTNDYIVAGIGDHLIIQYAGGPQHNLQANPHILPLSGGANNAALAPFGSIS